MSPQQPDRRRFR